ncbi:hypothetical protein MRX96_040099 [Rhipicephalus microplus]
MQRRPLTATAAPYSAMDEPRRSAVTCNLETALTQPKQPSGQCLLRLKLDLKNIIDHPVPGIFVEPEKGNVTYVHTVIVGADNTPCQGGLFHLVLKFPPPQPSLSTTGTLHDDRRRKGGLQPETVQQWTRLAQHSGHVSRPLVEPGDDHPDNAGFDPVIGHRAPIGH